MLSRVFYNSRTLYYFNINFRLGTCEEVANAITFLASAEASYITGQSLAVEGGSDARI